MANVEHPLATGDEVHRPVRWTPASAAARTAIDIGATKADDVGCFAWQTDENSFWCAIATGTGASKWAQVGGLSSAGTTVRAATTANITLSGTQTIDGVACIAGDRVLAKDQSTGANRGVYVVAAGAWSRATDYDESVEARPAVPIGVSEGTVNGNRVFLLTTDAPITLGSTSLTYADITAALGYAVGPGSATDGAPVLFDGTTGKLLKGGIVPAAYVDPLAGGTPIATATLTYNTSNGTADVTAYTVPASPTGVKRFRGIVEVRNDVAITGGGNVVVRAGTTTGGNELLVDSAAWTSATAAGVVHGGSPADAGASMPASQFYEFDLAAGDTIKVRATTAGGGIAGGSAKVYVYGRFRP